METLNVLTHDIQTHWMAIGSLFSIHNPAEYEMAVHHLNELLDEIGTNERHPLYDLLDTLGAVIHAYEEQHEPIPESTGGEMLQFFLEERGLSTSDLPQIGAKHVVDDIIRGTRELTASQIRALAQQFHTSPAVFV